MITDYSFGKMTIDGETYVTDVILLDDTVIPNWWRREGHRLSVDDLEKVLQYAPEVLIVGTGYMGMMKVPKETVEACENKGIELMAGNSRKSWKRYNELRNNRKTAAVFHLTC